jgi:cell wall-associated NlpC family hydrolase
MRCKFWIVLLVLFSKFNGFSQEKFIQHVVAKGETISKIAQQYNVKPAAIYNLNPDAKKGIKFKEILLVPVTAVADTKIVNSSSNVFTKQKEHLVLAKETLYGIAKQYGVKVTDLYAINPSLEKRGLRVGNNINVPVAEANELIVADVSKKENLNKEIKQVVKEQNPQLIVEKKEILLSPAVILDVNGNQVKEILPKETLYGIAKAYGITVAELKKSNPVLQTKSLKVGQKLVIPNATTQQDIQQVPVVQKEEAKIIADNKASVVEVKQAIAEKEADAEMEITHEVLAKETKYGIAKEFGITVKELEAQNPSIVNKLLIGDKLTIRTSKSNVKTPAKNFFSEAALSNNEESNYNVTSFHGTDFVDQLVATASDNIGVRYRTGGTSKDGFDCSGLMCTTFGAFDIQLPRTSFEQSQYGEKISNEEAQKGDLIFFKTNGRSRINHVGMVVEVVDGDIKFIHASVGGGVIISSIKEKYYSKRVTQINRVL